MPLQNRVDPFGNLVRRSRSRPVFMGNRGGRFITTTAAVGAALGVAAMDLLPVAVQRSPSRSWQTGATPNCSSSTKSPRWQPGISHALNAGTRMRKLLPQHWRAAHRLRTAALRLRNGRGAAPRTPARTRQARCTGATSMICPTAPSSRSDEDAFAVRGDRILALDAAGLRCRKNRGRAAARSMCSRRRPSSRCWRPAMNCAGT